MCVTTPMLHHAGLYGTNVGAGRVSTFTHDSCNFIEMALWSWNVSLYWTVSTHCD